MTHEDREFIQHCATLTPEELIALALKLRALALRFAHEATEAEQEVRDWRARWHDTRLAMLGLTEAELALHDTPPANGSDFPL